MTLPGRRFTLLVLLVTVVSSTHCGKKGPPQAPFIRIPSPVGELRVHRMGSQVDIGFTLPTQNRDGSQPADLVRIDVYAMTTQPRLLPDRELDLEEFQEEATLVGSLDVLPPDLASAAANAAAEAATLVGPVLAPPVDSRPAQGFPATITEVLTPATLIPVDPWADEREDEDEDDEEKPTRVIRLPLMTPPQPGPLQREYVVVGVSSKGEEGQAASRIAIPLVPPPQPPPPPVVTYTEEVVNVTWELPVGVRATVQEPTTGVGAITAAGAAVASSPPAPPASATPTTVPPAAEPTAAPATAPPGTATPMVPDAASPPATAPVQPPGGTQPGAAPATTPPGTPAVPGTAGTGVGQVAPTPPVLASRPVVEWPPATRYDLFEVREPGARPFVMPFPLNMTPLATPLYADKRVAFGVERCYGVMSLDDVGGLEIRSALSAPTCVTFVDTFAPEAPSGLDSVGTEGTVSLIWEPNEEEDLAGYLVLRGRPPGETLQPLTPEPVVENTYRDTTGEPGVGYVYAVVAVDTATPPNQSPQSELVQESAR